MILRNSILSIFRHKGKSGLFALLIFALTLSLALSVSVWASVAQFLEDCDDYYTTIGLVEYMGTGYPDDTADDAVMAQALKTFDSGIIANDEATLHWDVSSRSLGYIDGFWRTDNYMPDRMLSVFVVGNVYFEEENNLYSGIVMKVLHSLKSEDNTVILIDKDFGTFEKGHFYLVFGEIYYGPSPLLHLRAAAYDNAIAKSLGIEVPRMIDITSDGTDGKYYEIPEDSILVKVANTLPVTNNSVLVSATDDIMSLLPFHQEELYFVEGRAFSENEYSGESKVCIISQLMAERLGIGVGDSIDLAVAISDKTGVYNSFWVDNGFSYKETFTVVGITNTVSDKSWYVYVPKSTGVPSSQFPIGYTVGQAVLDNEGAADFYARMQSVLEDRFQLTIYDQGYSSVAIPFRTILSVAKIVTVVCIFVELAVIILFGFLFVYRQQETSETMIMLGTGRMKVVGYFLFSAGLISLVAAAAGSGAAYWLHDGILMFVAKTADSFALIDSRFSNGNLSITRTLEFAPQLEWRLFLIIGVIVFLFAILACLGFVISTFVQSRPSQKKQFGPNKERKTSHLGGGSMKYAILSILRGGARTLVVPILAAAVVLFFGQLAATSLRYQEQLEAIYSNTTIGGHYTDINGKQVGDLVVNGYDVASLYRTGYLADLSISRNNPYYYLGITQLADGTKNEIGPLYVTDSGFARESLEATILRGPDLAMTNDIHNAPEFFFSDSILMHFFDGFDETFLAVPYGDEKAHSCMISSALMEAHDIRLGDTIRVAIDWVTMSKEYKARIYYHYDLFVAGSYEKQGAEDTIYAPISLLLNTPLDIPLIWAVDEIARGIPDETYDTGYTFSDMQKRVLQRTTLNSASFTLVDARELIDLKDYLADYGYSQVQKVSSVREFIVLKDAGFNNAVASIKQQIRYINTLYPFLYVLVGIIALVVSYLLVVSRKKEIATMRGIGATRTSTFFSFFYEQSILCVLGTAIGLGVWTIAWGIPTSMHLWLVAGFLLCYFLGSAISVTIMNQTNVFTILLDRE